jgi:Rrf2 family protein
MISLTAEHALRAVVYLAGHPGACATVDCIARHAGIPAGSLAKVMQQLHRGGLVSSQRGPNGGFALARPAELLSFLEVITAVDGPRAPERSPALPRDAIGRHLDDARAQSDASHRATTIAQFLRDHETAGAAGAQVTRER